jgi:hypothetical protein
MMSTEWDWSLAEHDVPADVVSRIADNGRLAWWDGTQPNVSWAAAARAFKYYRAHGISDDLSIEFAGKFLSKQGINVDPWVFFLDEDK